MKYTYRMIQKIENGGYTPLMCMLTPSNIQNGQMDELLKSNCCNQDKSETKFSVQFTIVVRDRVLVQPFYQKIWHKETANPVFGNWGLNFSHHASGHKTTNSKFG